MVKVLIGCAESYASGGTANVFASYWSASTVAVVSGLVVWLTRKSLLKREHRGD